MAPSTLLTFVWLEVTGLCNEFCDHCYADSSPQGTHGTMTVRDWKRAIDQLADMGTEDVQFIGGEPTLYPHLPELIEHAYAWGLGIEVFSNMTHIRDELWGTFVKYGVKLATSYYSDDAQEHDQVTRARGSHKKTRANIRKAIDLGMPIRGGVISVNSGQRIGEAARDLTALGVGQVDGDRTRAFGRAGQGAAPTVADLCGHCAHGKCAIGPTGDVWPCVLGRFLSLGNVKDTHLADIWTSTRTATIRADIAAARPDKTESCNPPSFLPSCSPCLPVNGVCDPKEADTAPGMATISAPA